MNTMNDMIPVAEHLKRAYRDDAPEGLTPAMQDLLRRLHEQDKAQETAQD